MTSPLRRLLSDAARRFCRNALVLFLTGAAALAGAFAHEAPGRTMLSLGDSVVFGYITQDGYAYLNPDNLPTWRQSDGMTD